MGEKKRDKSVDNLEAPDKPSNKGYPKSIFFIIGNEFCERFSYYGMKTILVLYFRNVLKYSEDTATEAYHIFAMACYFTPVLGAIIADSLLGKFKTILYISILYAIGNCILSYASFLTSAVVTMIGLTFIAFGTGGIKPCVSAFGGDQFGPGQERQLQKFFSFFYISINAGSLLSTFITPILREDVNCFDREDCYPLAFGVPALLMIVALILFIAGKYITDYKIIPPSSGNIVVTVVKCVFTALGRKWFKSTEKKNHWLDYADDKYDAKTIADIKAVMRVLFLYLPLPIFWALFDQTGSRWTLQATRMDGNFFGVYRIKPDQIQVVNPILIILLIPVFEYAVYPLFRKINFLAKPLQRITTGGMLAALSFVICAFFQFRIEAEIPSEPSNNFAHLAVLNGLPCDISISNLPLFEKSSEKFNAYQMIEPSDVEISKLVAHRFDITIDDPKCSYSGAYFGTFDSIKSKDVAILFVHSINETSREVLIAKFDAPALIEKPEEGGANVKIVFNLENYDISQTNGSFILKNKDFDPVLRPSNSSYSSVGETDYVELDIAKGGDYSILFNDGSQTNELKSGLPFKQGGSYVVLVHTSQSPNQVSVYTTVKPNTVSMMWQIIPYLVITAGEIMFSITGLEFSYSQAPMSMKSVLQAAWLLTVAFGNLIVAIVATAKIFKRQSFEFLFFAALMVLDMLVFAIMAYFYVPYSSEESDEDSDKRQHLNGTALENGKPKEQQLNEKHYSNEAFSDEDTKI